MSALVAVGALVAALLVGVTPARAATAQPGWAPLTPTARSDAAMAYDSGIGQMVLFGGADTDASLLSDTWTTNGTTWTEAAPSSSPSARSDEAMAYDPSLGRVVLFGGLGAGNTTLSDTWTYDGTTWSQLSPATSPPAGVRLHGLRPRALRARSLRRRGQRRWRTERHVGLQRHHLERALTDELAAGALGGLHGLRHRDEQPGPLRR